MRVTIGERQAELALTSGTMFSAESALKVGLVDEIANDQEDLMIRVRKHIERQAAIPGELLIHTVYILPFDENPTPAVAREGTMP